LLWNLGVRLFAATLIVIMNGAIAMVHGSDGTLISSGGVEYDLALFGLLVLTSIAGSARYSIGRSLPLDSSRGLSQPILDVE
jgi:uncharacterized membrane protein YphA (DoxX/SURF4 family)